MAKISIFYQNLDQIIWSGCFTFLKWSELSRKRSCHSEIHQPKRVSVIMQKNAEACGTTGYYSGPTGSQYNSPVPLLKSFSRPPGPSGFKYLSPESNGIIKIEHPSSLETYGMCPYVPSNASSSSSRANYTIPGNGQGHCLRILK